MEVKQIYGFVNTATQEAIGEIGLINEDLGNLVDVGNEVFNASAVDKYVKSLVNHIGRVIFVDRIYRGHAPSVLRESWEFGSVLEKIQAEIPEARENQAWELEDGQSYDPNIFYKPTVTAKFYNSKTTFEIPMSITERQVKQSFSNAGQLNAFVSMIYNAIENSATVKLDEIVMRTVNNFMATTIYDEYEGQNYTTKSGTRAINLLYEYNQDHPGATLTAATCLQSDDFIRYAVFKIGLVSEHMASMSVMFNLAGKKRFTTKDRQTCIMLADFEKACGVYLYNAKNQYNTDNLSLPSHEVVPYWQGSGTSFAFADTSAIKVTDANGDETELDGIICTIFDRDAVVVSNEFQKATSVYNDVGDFYNVRHKYDCGFLNDFDENGVVFFIK